MDNPTILVIGTYDTKEEELCYLAERIETLSGRVKTMDVSVLGQANHACDISKHQVAEAADSTIQQAIDSGDENTAMQIMAKGASHLTAELHRNGHIQGVLVLGGTMGTDLALDVCESSRRGGSGCGTSCRDSLQYPPGGWYDFPG